LVFGLLKEVPEIGNVFASSILTLPPKADLPLAEKDKK